MKNGGKNLQKVKWFASPYRTAGSFTYKRYVNNVTDIPVVREKQKRKEYVDLRRQITSFSRTELNVRL